MRNGFEEGCSETVRVKQQQLALEERRAPLRDLVSAFARNIAVLALALFASYPSAGAQKAPTTDQTQIVDTVKTVFAAAQADDITLFNTVIAPAFYLYDGGIRFDGDAIIAFIKTQHAAGKRFEWNVTEPDVHISGNTAWIAYVNKGSITDASGTSNQKWLESAFLEKQAAVWKIVFMHSTRVPAEGAHGK